MIERNLFSSCTVGQIPIQRESVALHPLACNLKERLTFSITSEGDRGAASRRMSQDALVFPLLLQVD